MRYGGLRVFTTQVLIAGLVWGLSAAPRLRAEPPSSSAKGSSCASAEYHQFDFWVGDWDVFDHDHPGSPVAHAVVRAQLGGCVITEDFKNTPGSEGMSLSAYDAYRKQWQQSWVSNRPQVLFLTGHARGAAMTLSGREATAAGSQLVRGTWAKIDGGGRETAVVSEARGKSWKPWFDLVFRPHAAR